MNYFELDILFKIREIFQNPVFDFLMPIITLFGDAGIFWIAVSLFMMISKKYRKAGFSMGLALLIGVIIGNGILKNIVGRIRPYDLENGIIPLAKNLTSDYSFPSGHTLASFEAASALVYFHKKEGICALILAFLIGFSRLYLGVHYPTDVIFGMILGILFAVISVIIVKKCFEKYEKYKKAKETKNEN